LKSLICTAARTYLFHLIQIIRHLGPAVLKYQGPANGECFFYSTHFVSRVDFL